MSMSDPKLTYKLIILHFLLKSESPLTFTIISDFIIENGYTHYFNVQNAFSELCDDNMIQAEKTYNTSYYHVTDTGKQYYDYFISKLSSSIRKEIEKYLLDNKKKIHHEIDYHTDYTRTRSGGYLTSCSLRESGNMIYQNQIYVATEEEAIRICENWEKKADELYTMSILQLME